MKEGFFETFATPTIDQTPVTGSLDAMVVGDTTITGIATNFDPEFTAGELITFIDAAGERQFYTIASITNDTSMVINQPIRTVSNIANTDFNASVIQTPSFVVRDALNLTYPLGDPIFGFNSTAGFRMSAPDNSGVSARDAIDNDEGITIKTIYVRNPFQHTWADKGVMLIFRQIVNGGTLTETVITQLGVNGEVYIPGENIEIPVNIYIPPFVTAQIESLKWGLTVNVQNAKSTQNQSPTEQAESLLARMSNVSVPTEMDGLLLPLVIGVRFTYGLTITG